MGQQRRHCDAQYKADVVPDILINGKGYGEARRIRNKPADGAYHGPRAWQQADRCLRQRV